MIALEVVAGLLLVTVVGLVLMTALQVLGALGNYQLTLGQR